MSRARGGYGCGCISVEFVKLWRGVAVDGVDDKTIEDYLQKQGISSMEHVGIKRMVGGGLFWFLIGPLISLGSI